jgi:hypothetical protein
MGSPDRYHRAVMPSDATYAPPPPTISGERVLLRRLSADDRPRMRASVDRVDYPMAEVRWNARIRGQDHRHIARRGACHGSRIGHCRKMTHLKKSPRLP